MKIVSMVLSALLLFAPAAQTFAAGQKTDKQKSPIEQIKRDGAKTKGFVYSAGEDDFVMRVRKTATPTTIRYADVAKVDGSRGHSVARNVLIICAIGTAIVLASVYFAIRRNG